MNWYLDVLKNYAVFEGRARRKEYWMFVLWNFIISVVISLIAGLIRLPLLSGLYSLAVLIPGLAVGIRRLHDTGKSGFYILFSFIPLIGWIIVLYFMCKDGEPGENEYGVNPKEDSFIEE